MRRAGGDLLGGEDDLADMPPFSAMAWACGGFGEWHEAIDGEFEFAVADGFGVVDDGVGIGHGHDGVDVDGGMERGVGGWAEDAGEDAAGLYLGDEFGGDVVVDGVGDGVDEAEGR